MVGMMVTCLSGAYIWTATTRTDRIERIVEDRTLELRKKDEQLQHSQETKTRAVRLAHECDGGESPKQETQQQGFQQSGLRPA